MAEPQMHVRDDRSVVVLQYEDSKEGLADIMRWGANHGDAFRLDGKTVIVPAIGNHKVEEVGEVRVEPGDWLIRSTEGHWGRAPASEFA